MSQGRTKSDKIQFCPAVMAGQNGGGHNTTYYVPTPPYFVRTSPRLAGALGQNQSDKIQFCPARRGIGKGDPHGHHPRRHHRLRRQRPRGRGPAPNARDRTRPLGTQPGKDGRHWYFVCCGRGADGEIRIDRFKVGQDDQALAEQCRTALCLELVQRRPPIVLNDFDDELALVRWCEAIAPSERTTRLRAAVEAERRETAT